jgi:hypothetical protein
MTREKILNFITSWYFVYSVFFAATVGIYFKLHFEVRGVRVVYLNTTQLADIQSLIADTLIKEKRCAIKTYLETRFDFSGDQPDQYNFIGSVMAEDSVSRDSAAVDSIPKKAVKEKAEIKIDSSDCSCNHRGRRYGEQDHPAARALEKLLDQLCDAKYNIHFLTNYPLKVKSFFWLNESSVYWEIIFWTWFGIFANLFFNVSEALRKNEYRSSEQYVHVAKFFYGPPCSLIIYFSLDKLIDAGDVSFDSIQYGTIVLAFLLGFYTRKSIEMIDKIKNFVFGSKKEEEEDRSMFVPELTEKLLLEAISAKLESWKLQYPFIIDVHATSKTDEAKQAVMVLTVDVSVKDTELAKQFPKYLYYVTPANKVVKMPVTLNFINEDQSPSSSETETLG